ncbi:MULTISPECIES: hypothetical protein [Pseudomonas]|jgi:hypothetical protein|uniref:Uncharacterized protein n=4 Tax=Pseudomonas fluorescens group TaxID=136843 RepID=A0ABS0URG7_9PSED|nr:MULTISPECIES: hypothetical protein [Pseudomonas]KWV71487.1 hypothetical protein PFL603g_04938 [Pseudomonas fluorescens]MBI6568192.1 hypothetical protein [Pseudomonas synxantha]NMX46532.1 hypothetical protein [Pseudomonas sp. WS 5407]
MQKRIIALITLSIIGLTNTANAYTWPADQLYEESLLAERIASTCYNKPNGQQQFRRVYIINPDGTKNYINKGNGVYRDRFTKEDGYEITTDCYDFNTGYITDYDVGYDKQITKCDNPKAIGNITKYRLFEKWTSAKLINNLKTGFTVYSVIDTCKLPEFTQQSETKTEFCPINYIGKIVSSRTYNLYADGTKDNYSDWTKTQDTCVSRQTESEWKSCPQANYVGQIVNERAYDLYLDGTKNNYSDWVKTQDSCQLMNTKTVENYNCATKAPSYPLGFTLETWTRTVKDGIATDWKLNRFYPIENYCYYSEDKVTSTDIASCPAGQTGKIVKETHTKTKRFFLGYSKNDSSYIVETENSCKASGPLTVEIKPGSETVSCDVYYGTQAGTYTGNVTKTGDYITIFDPVSGATNTTFQAKSEDTTSCVKEITTTTKELIEEDCPTGFEGKITKYLVKAESSTGTVYPYGTTPILDSNTCIAVSVSDEINAPSAEHLQDSVLSNLSFTTTSISKSDLIINELNKIDTSKVEGKAYIMNVSADDLSAGAFDSTKISNLVKTFKTKLGTKSTSVKLTSAPVTLDKYIGQDGLTQSRISKERLALSGTSVNNGTVTVKYVSLAKSTPEHFSFTVKVFD